MDDALARAGSDPVLAALNEFQSDEDLLDKLTGLSHWHAVSRGDGQYLTVRARDIGVGGEIVSACAAAAGRVEAAEWYQRVSARLTWSEREMCYMDPDGRLSGG